MIEEAFSTSAQFWYNEVKAFLFARMDAIWTARGQAPHALIDFLQALARGTGTDLRYLAILYHVARDNGAHEYVTREIPNGVRLLTHANRSRLNHATSSIRGRIDWPATHRERAIRRDPTRYTTIESARTYDIPENRLLRNYLSALEQLTLGAKETRAQNTVGARLAATERIARESLRTSYLRELPRVADTTALMLARARRSKRSLYATLATLWEEYEATVLDCDLQVLKDIMSHGWLVPQTDDDLFELFVLIRTIQAVQRVFDQYSDTRFWYGLVRPDGERIATFEAEQCIAEIWFDRNPNDAGGDQRLQRYTELVAAYDGLSGTPRRPDIGLRICTANGPPCILLIEAKNTSPAGLYGRDSIYKTLAYTKDFEEIWRKSQTPKVVLAFPTGVSPRDPSTWLAHDVAIISDNIGERLDTVISKVIRDSLSTPVEEGKKTK